jgi:ubiquinol-cytochrome c reductase core subunit 2
LVRKNQGVLYASSFFNAYSDSGLFGVYAIAGSNTASSVPKLIHQELKAVANSEISQEELTRAKNLAKLAVYNSVDGVSSLTRFIGTHLLTGSLATNQVPGDQQVTDLDKLTAADVKTVAQKVLKSKPTFVAIGDVIDLPTVDQLA